MDLLELSTNEWLETLKPFQQELIETLIKNHSEEEIIEIWINITGPDYTASFGGTEKKDFLRNFRDEFNKLILEDEKYKDDIKELKSYSNVTKYFIVAFLSRILSKSLGVASDVVSPLIVLSLCIIGKMGLNAYKQSIKKDK